MIKSKFDEWYSKEGLTNGISNLLLYYCVFVLLIEDYTALAIIATIITVVSDIDFISRLQKENKI